MGLAPEALFMAGLLPVLEADGHTVSVAVRGVDLGTGDRLTRIGRNCATLAECVATAQREGELPVILGGDCLVSIRVVAGLRRALAEDFAVVWFDAHGDFNTPETTISDYLGGMPLACCCGRGLDELRAAACLTQLVNEASVALLGVRDLDPAERALLDSTRVSRFGPDQVARFTPAARPTYLHFDIDALDPSLAPGVAYLTPNGLTLEQALGVAWQVRPHLAALSLTTFNPKRDPSGQTVETAIALLRGLLHPGM